MGGVAEHTAGETLRVSTRSVVPARRRAASANTRSSVSTGRRAACGVPSSARARSRRSSTRFWARRASSSTGAATSSAVVVSGWAMPTSACWRIDASGERSSWEASETNRRWAIWECSSRPSISFMVRANRLISSSRGRTGTRRCSWPAEIASTSERTASTGESTRPATHHVVAPTSARRTGTPTKRRPATTRVASLTASSGRPTRSTTSAPSNLARRATTRNSSRSTGVPPTAVSFAPGCSDRTGSRPRTLAEAARTSPDESTTWSSTSSPPRVTCIGVEPAASASAASSARSDAAVRT